MALKGKQAVTTTPSALFGPGQRTHVTFQNRGTDTAYLAYGSNTPVVGEGLSIAAGESVCTKDLPAGWFIYSEVGFRAICDTDESTNIEWSV